MELVGKELSEAKVVVCGCGAAGYSCAKQFLALGVSKENLICVDVKVRCEGCVWVCACVFLYKLRGHVSA